MDWKTQGSMGKLEMILMFLMGFAKAPSL